MSAERKIIIVVALVGLVIAVLGYVNEWPAPLLNESP